MPYQLYREKSLLLSPFKPIRPLEGRVDNRNSKFNRNECLRTLNKTSVCYVLLGMLNSMSVLQQFMYVFTCWIGLKPCIHLRSPMHRHAETNIVCFLLCLLLFLRATFQSFYLYGSRLRSDSITLHKTAACYLVEPITGIATSSGSGATVPRTTNSEQPQKWTVKMGTHKTKTS